VKAGFLDKLIARLDRVGPGEVQGLLQKLVREKGFFEQVFEVLEEGVIICDPSGVVTFVNRAACGFYGMDHETSAGRPLEELLRGVSWEVLTRRREVVSRDMEVFYPENRYLNFYFRPIDDGEPGAAPLGYVMLVRDITQTRRVAEEQIESERLNALTVLAAGVAHEIGNPLNSLNIHLQLLEKKLKKVDRTVYESVRDQVEVARGEIKRLDFIIEQFLGAMRPVAPHFELTDVNRVVEEAASFLAPELKDRRITTRLLLHDGLPLVRLDPAQMKQALYNLIKNASHAMGTGGTLRLGTELTDYHVVIRIEDSGKGMSPETVAQMHQAWFTTKKTGNGLGMVIVRRIVREHGGELSVQSGEGQGTTVSIALPRQARPARFLESGEAETPRRNPGEVIDV
jgi:two-component system, sporulation sensor kinase E